MHGETPVSFPDMGAFMPNGWWQGLKRLSLRIVIQGDLGGGLRGPKGGKARGGGGIAFLWVVRGRLTDDGRTSLFFYEVFISSSVLILKRENLTWKLGLQSLQYAQNLLTTPNRST